MAGEMAGEGGNLSVVLRGTGDLQLVREREREIVVNKCFTTGAKTYTNTRERGYGELPSYVPAYLH